MARGTSTPRPRNRLHDCLPALAALPRKPRSGIITNPATLHADETRPLPAGEAFHSVGSVELDGKTTIIIRNEGTDGFVILDALQLLPSPR